MKNKKLLISILTGLCVCLASATLLTACDEEHTHSYTQQITTEATCTEKGVITYTCSCNDSYTEEIPALGHDETTHEAQTPTCTEIGWDEYVTCERDGCEYSTYEEIPATGNHTWDNGEITTEPTCTGKGVKAFTCTVCQTATKTEDIPALNHDKIQHNAQAPTCTEKGWESYETCSRCYYTTYLELPATGVHNWNIGEITTEPTCTGKGVKTFTCTVCTTTTYTEEVEKIAHAPTQEWKSDSTYHWHECECGDKTTKQSHIQSSPATATTAQTCTVCDYVIQSPVGIIFNTLTVTNSTVYGKVSNTTEVFSFISEITAVGDAKFVVSSDIYGIQSIATKTIPLNIGDNVVYITELVNDEPINMYTATIRRRPIHEVTFNTNGGTSVETQYVEEDSRANEPSTKRTGYTFIDWSYDFATPITQNTNITAIWMANTNTKYIVEYYLQNLENDEYTLLERDELEGATDSTATAEIKSFTHFTLNEEYAENKLSGNIDGDGSQVLSVYYTRNIYTLSINNSSLGSITNAGTYKYRESITTITTTAIPYLGCEFIGWYNGDELLFTDIEYTFTIEKDVTAKFAVKAEMSNFHFTSTTTACSITEIKDKTVTAIIVPDYVTSISTGAFTRSIFRCPYKRQGDTLQR